MLKALDSTIGSRPAVETVLAYISDLVTSVTWAEQELKGLQQVGIDPGENHRRHHRDPHPRMQHRLRRRSRVVESGEFELRVGPNSRAAKQHQAFPDRPG